MPIPMIAACCVLLFASINADTTNGVTTLDVERYSHLAKDIKHVFNNKDLEYSGLIHSTLYELYNLNHSTTALSQVQLVLDQHQAKGGLLNHAFDEDVERILGNIPVRSRKRGWWSNAWNTVKEVAKNTVSYVVDHKDEIQAAVTIGKALFGKRDTTSPERVIEYETHQLNKAKVTIDQSVLNVTVFLDKELKTLRDNLAPNGQAVGIPNQYTGSLTSAN